MCNKNWMACLSALLVLMLMACGPQQEQQQANAEEASAEEANAAPHSEMAETGNRGTAEAMFGECKVSIDYGRPKLQGRDMLAKATDGMVWRMGMNEATEITSTCDLQFGETTVPQGHYSLFAKKVTGDQWELLFNEKTGMWGAPTPKEGFVATVPLAYSTGADSAEAFTIALEAVDEESGMLKATWGAAVLSAEFSVAGGDME